MCEFALRLGLGSQHSLPPAPQPPLPNHPEEVEERRT